MICRTRPKFLSYDHFKSISAEIVLELDDDELFFNRGRNALKFLLCQYKKQKNKQLVVGMQSFNCNVVLDAAVDAGCKVLLLDIKKEDFSVSVQELKKLSIKIDALLLTHYQGIPNTEYEEIANYCAANNIFLIDDISQTEGSEINGYNIGALSDVQLRSFAFDKPITCMEGGSISIKLLKDENLKKSLIENYRGIPEESADIVNNDLNTLKTLFRITEPAILKYGYYRIPLLKRLLLLNYSEESIKKILKNPIRNKVHNIYRILLSNNFIPVCKIGNKKKRLIQLQREVFFADNSFVMKLTSYINSHTSINVNSYKNCKINWNRFSVLDNGNAIKKLFSSLNVEQGNYNWPKTLFKTYRRNKNVLLNESDQISLFCSENVVNIPCWIDYLDKSYQENYNDR